ncbi:MAG: murein biosynthesis integral membrane protein MurJ [Armatimonadota bacterium]|nr:murein biosynthesis integral membrane protein MurJ [Armatimonadota bacterium]
MSVVPPQARLARAASLLATATVASRLLGLLREIVVAALFGASDAKAAYVIGYYLPFFVQRLLLGGTLSIVLIPTLADVLARGERAEMQRVTAQMFTAVLAVGVAMVLAGQIAAPLLVPIAAPGFAVDPQQLALTVHLTRVNFLAMFFLALSVYATAYLQAQRCFTPPAVAPIVFNLVTIAGTVWLGPRIGIVGLAVAWIAGTAAQFLVQVPSLLAGGFRFRLTLDWSHPAVRTVRHLAAPAMLGLAIVEINAYVGRFFASLLPGDPGVNAVAALDYAYEVVQAPVGILALSVATVLFPGMSQSAAAGDRPALRASTALGLRSVVFLMLPVSVGLAVFARPLIRLVFERGEFTPATTAVVASCLTAYALGLVPMAAYYVVTRSYYALHDMRTPVATGSGMVALNAVLAYAFMRVWGPAGIALASAMVAFVNVGVLLAILSRRLGALEGRRTVAQALRTGTATVLAVGAAWAIVHVGVPVPADRAGEAAVLVAAAGAAGLVYLAACARLRVEEIGLLRSLLRRPPSR